MVRVTIQPSRWFARIVALLYLVTGVIWFYLPLPLSLKGIAVILHSLHYYGVWYCSLSLKAKESIIYLEYTQEGQWLLANTQGELFVGILQYGSICTRSIAILHFKLVPNQQSRYLLILPDSTSIESFRRLRQRLLG